MIIVMGKEAGSNDVKSVIDKIKSAGLKAFISEGEYVTIIGVVGDVTKLKKGEFERMDGVDRIVAVMKPYKQASRDFHPKNSVIEVDGVKIGGEKIVIAAGPCAIESEEFLFSIAESVKKSGAEIFRASAYKPRTSPYDFQGMGEKGLKMLKKVKEETGLVVETEVMDTRNVELVAKYVDILRIGARNMQNFDLLKEVGKINKPVILKNGISATISEFLMAAEYIMSEGNKKVILCYRGIRTHETAVRNSMDILAIPVLKANTHLPVIVDPSHAAGNFRFIEATSKAAIAAGADGLLIEVHCNPEKAMCDGKQSLTTEKFDSLMKNLKAVAVAVDRKM
ncbi:MAG: 3-deoxy-7-phosphoheptulonate synthase [Candidatus Diapherotrites archaeon]